MIALTLLQKKPNLTDKQLVEMSQSKIDKNSDYPNELLLKRKELKRFIRYNNSRYL